MGQKTTVSKGIIFSEGLKMIQFTVYGNPIALKRHRQGKWGNYDPSKGDKADFLAKCVEFRPEMPIVGPIAISLVFVFQRPKSHYKGGVCERERLKPTSPVLHTKKPDLDNLIKFVADALNGIYFLDDSQINKVKAIKIYGEIPRVECTIEKARE